MAKVNAFPQGNHATPEHSPLFKLVKQMFSVLADATPQEIEYVRAVLHRLTANTRLHPDLKHSAARLLKAIEE